VSLVILHCVEIFGMTPRIGDRLIIAGHLPSQDNTYAENCGHASNAPRGMRTRDFTTNYVFVMRCHGWTLPDEKFVSHSSVQKFKGKSSTGGAEGQQ